MNINVNAVMYKAQVCLDEVGLPNKPTDAALLQAIALGRLADLNVTTYPLARKEVKDSGEVTEWYFADGNLCRRLPCCGPLASVSKYRRLDDSHFYMESRYTGGIVVALQD